MKNKGKNWLNIALGAIAAGGVIYVIYLSKNFIIKEYPDSGFFYDLSLFIAFVLIYRFIGENVLELTLKRHFYWKLIQSTAKTEAFDPSKEQLLWYDEHDQIFLKLILLRFNKKNRNRALDEIVARLMSVEIGTETITLEQYRNRLKAKVPTREIYRKITNGDNLEHFKEKIP